MQVFNCLADLAKVVPSLLEADSTVLPAARASQDEMLLCLCSKCAQQFYDSPAHRIRRFNRRQKFKDSCDFCSMRFGWDYVVVNTECLRLRSREKARPGKRRPALV